MKRIAFIFFTFITLNCIANNNLGINNPQNWQHFQAVINQAEIAVKPLGAFVEYTLTLSISAKQPINISKESQLEITMDFELPSNSIICDSWLWIEGEAKQADILDRWTASAIYEAIVNRRKDPSLLVKNGNNQYRINIYPMKPTESRKFKFVYLSPAKINDKQLSIEIPSNILNLSTEKLSSIDAYIVSNNFFDEVSIENNELNIESVNHTELGNCTKISIPNEKFNSANIMLKKSDDEIITISNFEGDNEGYYQISFTASDLIAGKNESKKVCYLIDYDKNYTNKSLNSILDEIKKGLKRTLNESDKFNVIFSEITPSPVFDKWMTASDENIESAFSTIKASQYSNLITLLGKGIETLNKEGNFGNIVLITNNCSYTNISGANDIIKDLKKINTNNTPISIIDFTENYYKYEWTGSGYYYNNGYLFTILARQTGGEYSSFIENPNTPFSDRLIESIDLVSGKKITNIDIYTSNNNGFCYSRKNISSTFNNSYSLNKSIHHFGKYSGGLPTNLEVSFEIDNELFHFQKDLNASKSNKIDSTLKTIWSGLEISELEKQGYSNQVIGEIIDLSLDNRILSYYTAFLCVEDNVEICQDCGDEWKREDGWDGEVIVGVDDIDNKNQIKAFPNPFNTSIQIDLPNEEELLELKIFNTVGQCVKTINLISDQFSYTWDGTAENGNIVKKGIYLVKAVYAKKVFTIKVIKNI